MLGFMQESTKTVLFGLGGAVWGLFIAITSFGVAAAGHGWNSAWPFGVLSIFAAPLATISWARRRTSGAKLAFIVILVAVVADVLLIVATAHEGVRYFFQAFPFSIIWVALWISWQILAWIVWFPTSVDTQP
jgi:hypothetical protein